MKWHLLIIGMFLMLNTKAQNTDYSYQNIRFKAVNHAAFQMWYDGKYYLIDPSVDSLTIKELGNPDYILYTDIHGDHFNDKNLRALKIKSTTVIIAPSSVKKLIDEKLSDKHLQVRSVANNASIKLGNVQLQAIPMYNLTTDRLKFHSKGRGNGYVIHLGKANVYISGDTEDIQEMRALKNIDVAFVCMNLPYTMDVSQAAEAVLAFKPKVVIPYHYRGQNGLSDVAHFKVLVQEKDAHIEVPLLKWYK